MGQEKRRYTSSQVSRARSGQDEPETAPSYELRLYPSQSHSPARVTALAHLASFCSQGPNFSGKGVELIPGGGGGNDDHRPRRSGKVGMRYFHRPRNKFYCPTVNTDRLWSLGPYGVKDPVMACDVYSALLTGITPPCCPEIRGQNNFPDSPRY